MHCDPLLNPAVAYYICNDSVDKTFTLVESNGVTRVLHPRQCAFLSAQAWQLNRLCNVSFLISEDVCQDEWLAGVTIGGVNIPCGIFGITSDGAVVGPPGPVPVVPAAAHSNYFDPIDHASIDDVFEVGVGTGQAFTYATDLLANDQWYRLSFGFTAQTLEFDNHLGDQDFYFFIPQAGVAVPIADGAAGASGIVHGGSEKSWNDEQGLAGYVYIQPVNDNVEIHDGDGGGSGATSTVAAFAT